MIGVGGGVEESIVVRIRCDLTEFRDLLSVLTSKVFSVHTKGKSFQECARIVILYVSKTREVKDEDLAWWYCGYLM